MNRRPLIESHTISLARLPESLDGLSLLLISDIHMRQPRARHERLIEELADLPPVDLLVFGGDFMQSAGHETAALDLLERLIRLAVPRYGSLGVFGNHDNATFRKDAGRLPVRWMTNGTYYHDELAVSFLGVDCAAGRYTGDMGLTLAAEGHAAAEAPLRILLAHMPDWLPVAADAGIDLVLSGHTHGGQVRTPLGHILHNGHSEWPLRLSSGVIRMNRTLGVIGRGLGESAVERLRLFCPPQAPLLTLRRDDQPPTPTAAPQCLVRW
jgi:hypothetical protein